jgi:hypothetical protein
MSGTGNPLWLPLQTFIETVDETNRQKFEQDYTDTKTGVRL